MKTGQGFYQYRDGKRQEQKICRVSLLISDLTNRLILRLLNEVMKCLHESVVENEDLADAGVMFGTDFAPFRGGPIHYAKSIGTKEIIKTLERLKQ